MKNEKKELLFNTMIDDMCDINGVHETIKYFRKVGVTELELVTDMRFSEKDVINSRHDLYLDYLQEWIQSHSEYEFAGQSPVSFDEWLENENRMDGEKNV